MLAQYVRQQQQHLGKWSRQIYFSKVQRCTSHRDMTGINATCSNFSACSSRCMTSKEVEMGNNNIITVRCTLSATLTNCQYERYIAYADNNNRRWTTYSHNIRRFNMVCTLICDGSFAVVAIVAPTYPFYFQCGKFFFGISGPPVFELFFAFRSCILPESARSRALPLRLLCR